MTTARRDAAALGPELVADDGTAAARHALRPPEVEQLTRTGHDARGTASALLRAADHPGAAVGEAGSRGRSALREVLLARRAAVVEVPPAVR